MGEIFNKSTLENKKSDLLMYQKDIEITERSLLFRKNEYAIETLVKLNFLDEKIQCLKCKTECFLVNRKKALNQTVYRCCNGSCRKEHSLLVLTQFSSVKLKLCDILFIFYKFIKNTYNYDICNEVNITRPTLSKIIKTIRNSIKKSNSQEFTKLGGAGRVIQIDETAVSRKGIIKNPTSSIENCRKTKWLMGFIDENDFSKFNLQLLTDRTVETFTTVIKNNVFEKTVVKTDGYPSYPKSIAAVNCTHVVVNHQNGFKNEEGNHTNYIENLWSCLKSDIGKRHGIRREMLNSFIEEWKWKRKNIPKKEAHYFIIAFWRLCSICFKK